MRNKLTAPAPPHSEQSIRDWLTVYIGRQVREEQIPPDRTFEEYGLDSRSAVRLSGVLEKAFALELDPGLLFEYRTIGSLAAYLAERLGCTAPEQAR